VPIYIGKATHIFDCSIISRAALPLQDTALIGHGIVIFYVPKKEGVRAAIPGCSPTLMCANICIVLTNLFHTTWPILCQEKRRL
jgi:hypothetical protein